MKYYITILDIETENCIFEKEFLTRSFYDLAIKTNKKKKNWIITIYEKKSNILKYLESVNLRY